MTLKQDIYQAFEDVVGTNYITEDTAIQYSYAKRSGLCAGPDQFVQTFDAILLPKSTTEVQAIVKLCNRFKIQFKASSTGWAFFCDPSTSGVIKLDLRRMNRILEINEKSMYAVVEPYVIGAQLQAELMKKGLNCNLTGAGANCSALPLAAHENIGHMGQSASYGERNQLALEWVTPEGDIVRLGSLGSTGEWFCGDGPGPSLRGIIRGSTTPLGGLGVYTKAAMKIYHWPGPSKFPVAGVSPHYAPQALPDQFMIRYVAFSSKEKRLEALQKIGESEIAFEIMGFAPSMVAANIATSNEEDMELLKKIKASIKGFGTLVIILGNSPLDFGYKKKVFQRIMEEFEGKSLKLVEDPKIGGALLWRCIRICGSIRETLRATGSFGGVVGGTDLIGQMNDYIDETLVLKEMLIKKGIVLDDGVESFIQTLEHGHYGHAELLIRFFANPKNMGNIGELVMESNNIALKKGLPLPHQVAGDEFIDMFGPSTSHFNVWLRRIKAAFDPSGTAEASGYVTNK